MRNDIYVFYEEDCETFGNDILHFMLNGVETISHLSLTTLSMRFDEKFGKFDESSMAMNDKYIFTARSYTSYIDSTVISQYEYRVPESPPKYISVGGSRGKLLAATNDYLYYHSFAEYFSPHSGNTYQYNIKNGNIKKIAQKKIKVAVALIPQLNLIACQKYIINYKKNTTIYVHGEAGTFRHGWISSWVSDIFYSRDDNAFIMVPDGDIDVNKWRSIPLVDIHASNLVHRVPRGWDSTSQKTGHWVAPYRKVCINDRCTTGVVRAYREQTGCEDLSGLSGNQIYDYLLKSSKSPQPKFKEIEASEIYEHMENIGGILIAAHKDPDDHGHVVLFPPMEERYPSNSDTKEWFVNDNGKIIEMEALFPHVMDTGPEKPLKKQAFSDSYEFSKFKDVKYFAYIGKGCKKQQNKNNNK